MKIALLTDGIYPYVIGGIQKHSFYLVKYFVSLQIEVDLYHTSSSPAECGKLDCFTAEEKRYIRSYVVPFPRLDKFPGHYIREMHAYSAELFVLLKKNGPVDFVYVQGLCGMKLLEEKAPGFSTGVNFHGLEMFQKVANLRSYAEQFLFRKPVLRAAKNAGVVFSLGGKLTELLVKKGIPRNKIIEIPIGVDETWIRTEELRVPSVIRFVFVGRYERRKGIRELSAALRQLGDAKFEFCFIGAVPDQEKVNIPGVHYEGNISDSSKIKKILRASDVLVCPSYSEGMPTVILEAMASGLAIIASNVGAVSEQVSEKNGLLIRPGDIKGIKNAMIECMEMPAEKLLQMKRVSIQQVRGKFLWEKIIVQTVGEINRITSKQK